MITCAHGAINVAAMSFELQPTLRSDRVTLRPLHADDFDALYAVAADPEIWEQHPNTDRYRRDVFRTFFDEQVASGGALVVIANETRRVIGMTRFHGYDRDRSEIEIGWTFLARSHWGGVYNGEIKRLMLTHAFQFVDRVLFIIGVQNSRSQGAIEKIGGVRIGERLDDTGRESFVYEITKSTGSHGYI